MDDIIDKATDFFDEITDIFKVYQQALLDSTESTNEGVE